MNCSPAKYQLGDLVSIQSPRESDQWIARTIEFCATGNTTDDIHMNVRWFYTKSELSADVPFTPLSDQSLFNDIRWNELLFSDHIEYKPTHVLIIIERINLAQTKFEYSRIIQNGGMFRNTKLVRFFLQQQSGTFTNEQLLRRLKSNELIQTLRKPYYHENFCKPKLQKEATKLIDEEVEVSNAFCTDDERNTENRREMQRFKLEFKKVIQKETERNNRSQKLLQDGICVSEKQEIAEKMIWRKPNYCVMSLN